MITDGAGGQIYLSDLQRYFSGLGGAGAAGGAGARVPLAAALAAPDVLSAATEPAAAARLQPHLPPQDDVRTTLLSPQFAQVNLHVKRSRSRLRLVAPGLVSRLASLFLRAIRASRIDLTLEWFVGIRCGAWKASFGSINIYFEV